MSFFVSDPNELTYESHNQKFVFLFAFDKVLFIILDRCEFFLNHSDKSDIAYDNPHEII